jgi:hypothetical protein
VFFLIALLVGSIAFAFKIYLNTVGANISEPWLLALEYAGDY